VIRVLVADDHLAVREGIRTLLANEREITIVGEADDGSTALSLARTLRPDLIVLDDSMPGIGSLDVARKILAEVPGAAIVFLARDPGMRDLRSPRARRHSSRRMRRRRSYSVRCARARPPLPLGSS